MLTSCNLSLMIKMSIDGTYYAFYCSNRIVFNFEGGLVLWKVSKK